MGFDWEKYDGGGDYITAAEKKVITESGIPFKVTAVRFEEADRFEGKPRHICTLLVPNPETGDEEERLLAFPFGSGVESRDRLMRGFEEHFADGGEPVDAKLEKVGRSFLLRSAE